MSLLPKTIELAYGERVVAVVPEVCSGPGWTNHVVWVFVAAGNGGLREECIQPEEMTPAMNTLFDVGAEVCSALYSAVPKKVLQP